VKAAAQQMSSRCRPTRLDARPPVSAGFEQKTTTKLFPAFTYQHERRPVDGMGIGQRAIGDQTYHRTAERFGTAHRRIGLPTGFSLLRKASQSRSQRLYDGAQPGGEVFARRIVEIEPVFRRTPRRKVFDELPAVEIRMCAVFPHIGERHTGLRRLDHQLMVVQRKRAGRLEFDDLARAAELPGIGRAARIDVADADMAIKPPRAPPPQSAESR